MNNNYASDFIICYIDINNQNCYAICNDPSYVADNNTFDTERYISDHQTDVLAITGIYDTNTNLIDVNKREREAFERECRNYGFAPSDYKALVTNTSSEANYQFVGFHSRNTRYKLILRDTKTGRHIKSTLMYVQRHIVRNSDKTNEQDDIS